MDFRWPVRVYYEDTDAGGVVFHANYLKFFERARTEMLRSLGHEIDRLAAEPGLLFVVRSASLDYLRPARLNQLLTVGTRVAECRRTSLVFAQTASHQGVVLCAGDIRVACVGARTLRPIAIPDFLLAQLKP